MTKEKCGATSRWASRARRDGGDRMIILGIHVCYGDVSAAFLGDGQLAAAVEDERVRRVKHWA
jgi:hypothetical protein